MASQGTLIILASIWVPFRFSRSPVHTSLGWLKGMKENSQLDWLTPESLPSSEMFVALRWTLIYQFKSTVPVSIVPDFSAIPTYQARSIRVTYIEYEGHSVSHKFGLLPVFHYSNFSAPECPSTRKQHSVSWSSWAPCPWLWPKKWQTVAEWIPFSP